MKKVKALLPFFIFMVLIIGGLYWFATDVTKRKAAELKQINSGFGYGKGIITGLKSYKGHSIDIRYQIDNKVYEYNGGWDYNPNDLSIGDSIKFRYALDAPELLVTEMEKAY